MQIMLAYFEMIAKYEDGFIPRNPTQGKSAEYFKRGVKSVFPELSSHPNQADVDSFLKALYEKARCGLYHVAQSEAGIVLSGDFPSVMSFDPTQKQLYINPHQLPAKLKQHLTDYTQRLKLKQNGDLWDKFERRFDYDNKPPSFLPASVA